MFNLVNTYYVISRPLPCYLLFCQQQEPFKIPDMAFCMSWLEGCLNFGYSCFYPGVAYWFSAGNFVSNIQMAVIPSQSFGIPYLFAQRGPREHTFSI